MREAGQKYAINATISPNLAPAPGSSLLNLLIFISNCAPGCDEEASVLAAAHGLERDVLALELDDALALALPAVVHKHHAALDVPEDAKGVVELYRVRAHLSSWVGFRSDKKPTF